ncbi:Dam family site-specific DNA-(adenine-N6)-methyltransferase [Duncaniella sp.]|uniref:DNA adenine methylase n=1 Tax=Duncaniella sp. TaxID=2518496 RepID=UPI002631180E|nr:Dam family site-specific DNA-(adenine-N6)-methyltransferase [Duncaniella sp.]
MNKFFTVSPLNYIGGKARILDQVLPYFPLHIDHFVDLFCGGCNVGINTRAQHHVYNDKSSQLIGLLSLFATKDPDSFIQEINHIIDKYEFSRTSEHNFAFYGGNCMKGVSEYNREKFITLRDEFNSRQEHDDYYYTLLYILIVFGFNNQMRFNSQGDYNLPVGKRDFNNVLQNKLKKFMIALQRQETTISNFDFRHFNTDFLTENSLVYVDPPYLITGATYNENGGWTKQDEYDLLLFLDGLNDRGIHFALSNVLRHKGKDNPILLDWVNDNDYNLNQIQMDYSNSNYQVKGKDSGTQEVLITNYNNLEEYGRQGFRIYFEPFGL